MSKVVLIRCESYDYTEVKAAVQRGIDLLGGASQFAKPDEKILFKPNWIVPVPPEKCATTHPMVFKAVSEVFLTTGENFLTEILQTDIIHRRKQTKKQVLPKLLQSWG